MDVFYFARFGQNDDENLDQVCAASDEEDDEDAHLKRASIYAPTNDNRAVSSFRSVSTCLQITKHC